MASRTAMKPLFRCFPRRLAATTPALSRSIHTSIQSSRQIASAFPSCARRASPVNTTLRSQKRWHSVPASKSKVYDFQQVRIVSLFGELPLMLSYFTDSRSLLIPIIRAHTDRCSRTTRVHSWLHTHSNQHPHNLKPRGSFPPAR